MKPTDSGWVAIVKLGPGKYWYKFIVDGNWMVDPSNQIRENDGRGNINSVFYRTNQVFTLPGFPNAKKVYLSGSFNSWRPRELLMTKTESGWELPIYLARGTHTYRFVVDGTWMDDPVNPQKLPNEFKDYNSVIRIGKAYTFRLDGFTNAKQVVLSGSFNNWREDELFMNKTALGWELPYTIGPGNYEYRFKVDDKWIPDPSNPLKAESGNRINSYLVIEPNYTFRLKGFGKASKVFLTGDFNNWNPSSLPMQKNGDGWVFSVHLSAGKHQYKFIVDGEYIRDPANNLWEQNEQGTGNSIIWKE
jgi:1,4-alpha-glucan branching enzyme